MADHTRVPLKVVDPPRKVLEAPPTLVASSGTVSYTCGQCGTVLLQAEHQQVHNLVIHCKQCGTHNTTD
jgi:DNA-directed RNA polymerase subunit RPC12/RpoP